MINLNNRQRTLYIQMCASIDSFELFQKEKVFKDFKSDTRRSLNTVITKAKKMRDQIPAEVDLKSCKAMLHDIKNYKLDLVYTGTDRTYVSIKSLEDLMEFAIMGMCKGCERKGKDVKRCTFLKEWEHLLVESGDSCGECVYSFGGGE